jgi:hypothetical protein
MKKLFLVLVGITMISCTDATLSKITSYGSEANIKCYSGGIVIYEGASTGKVQSEKNSDGYFFKEEGTGRLLEVSGNCIIDYGR